jgi:energy-coupling factor transporter ATP-binding protein EcfA2
MRIDKVNIKSFKNLRDFEIDINESMMKNVLLGRNASGKSNFLEALVIIFRDLDLDNVATFPYSIDYECNGYKIRIDTDTATSKVIRKVDGVDITRKEFYSKKDLYLPRYLFAYYSGVSNRLEKHFDTHQSKFYQELLSGNDEPMRPLFYAQLVHSNFVLMAFYSFQEEETQKFLAEYLDIVGLESVLFVLKEPEWAKRNKGRKTSDGDSRFWKARGKVKDFLGDLYEIALAPIKAEGTYRKDFLHPQEKEEHLYLYVATQESLQKLAELCKDNVNFFKMLESTYMSDLIREVRVKVKKKNADGTITFKELSEGEQQLLTVLGLLRFTRSDESIILLDEPDTHLNPLWKWQYFDLLEKIVRRPQSTQIFMTTHDPLVIGGLEKEQIRIFEKADADGHINVWQPEFSPKGLGVAGILIELFGLESTVDPDTQEKFDKKRELEIKKEENSLTEAENTDLLGLIRELESYGFSNYTRDPLYAKFMKAVQKIPEFNTPRNSQAIRDNQDRLALDILEGILKEEKE